MLAETLLTLVRDQDLELSKYGVQNVRLGPFPSRHRSDDVARDQGQCGSRDDSWRRVPLSPLVEPIDIRRCDTSATRVHVRCFDDFLRTRTETRRLNELAQKRFNVQTSHAVPAYRRQGIRRERRSRPFRNQSFR